MALFIFKIITKAMRIYRNENDIVHLTHFYDVIYNELHIYIEIIYIYIYIYIYLFPRYYL